jgi:hypothetical protein
VSHAALAGLLMWRLRHIMVYSTLETESSMALPTY